MFIIIFKGIHEHMEAEQSVLKSSLGEQLFHIAYKSTVPTGGPLLSRYFQYNLEMNEVQPTLHDFT